MIYLTGDTHADFGDYRFKGGLKHLKSDDTLIVLGDWGFDWDKKTHDRYLKHKHKFRILFLQGNHDNVDILNSLPLVDMYDDIVGDFGNNTYWLLNGHMYNIENVKFFVFGGAASIDKKWRVIEEEIHNCPRTLWWPEEVPSDETLELAKETLKKNNWTFDYFLAHTCRPDLKSLVLGGTAENFIDPTEYMIQNLEEDIQEYGGSFKEFYFGHFHTSKSLGKYHCMYDDVIGLV